MAVDRVAVLSAAVGVVAVCAALAAFGFQGRITAVGVDLGTTYSVIGVRNKAGTHIIADAEGRVLLPSVVSFMPGGAVKTGYEAQEALPANPKNTIYNAKRFIGSQWSADLDSFVQQNYAFRILPNNTGSSGVAFQLDAPGHPPTVAPEEVGAHVLRRLLDNAYRYLGHKQVRTAVIAVPAKFDEVQRVATARAFELAGLKVTRVMEEPVAAAVAYGLHTQENVTHILVYDFGGGTLDVSLLYVRDGSVQVYANEGDDQLGGSDFDHCLASKVLARIEERAGVDALPSTTTTMTDVQGSKDICTAPRIRQLSEAAKRELSFKDTACVSCRLPGKKTSGDSSGGEEISVCVKREEFEEWCSDVFARALAPVHRLLTGLGMKGSDIDEVVLVGGTTRTPKVKELLRAEFGADKINDHIDPDVTVAVGTATIID